MGFNKAIQLYSPLMENNRQEDEPVIITEVNLDEHTTPIGTSHDPVSVGHASFQESYGQGHTKDC